MPAGVLTDAGCQEILQNGLGASVPMLLPWQLILVTEDFIAASDTDITDLTEADWSGYSRVNLTRALWTGFSAIDGCCSCSWSTTPIVWTCSDSSGPTIYGWAALQAVTDLVYFSQEFDPDDQLVLSAGVQYQLLPQISLTTGQCTDMALHAVRSAKQKRKG